MAYPSAPAGAVVACTAAAVMVYARWRRRRREQHQRRVLVVGSINVDLYQRTVAGAVRFSGKPVDVRPLKGMTLPASSFVAHPKMASQPGVASRYVAGEEEAFLLTMDGPFEQKTGGKGANAAAAAAQTFACELYANLGSASATENGALTRDLAAFGGVGTRHVLTLEGRPTGTAYILLFDDNDNAIVLLGGANQAWPPATELEREGGALHAAVARAGAVMLQREVPPYVNRAAAKLARSLGVPVFMDVGGTDAPLDEELMPYLDVVAPNESELAFISGVEIPRDDHARCDLHLVRRAVGALKDKFARHGAEVEVLVTLGAQGSLHFGASWREGGVTSGRGGEGVMSRGGGGEGATPMGRFALNTPDGKPRDTTGAGDCYRGSYVAMRYGEGRSIAEAMRWAAAAAACSVEVEGAMPSMPTRAAIAQRYAQPLLPLAHL